MTLIDLIFVRCPNCGQQMRHTELLSYHSFGSVNWSDGRREGGDPLSFHDDLCLCFNCGEAFWGEEHKVADRSGGDEDEEYPYVGGISDLPWRYDDGWQEKLIGLLQGLLEAGLGDTEVHEFNIRQRLWWTINDIVRHEPELWSDWRPKHFLSRLKRRRSLRAEFRKHAELQRENLMRMIYLYIKGEPDRDLVYLANMYREMGDFPQARKVLDQWEGEKGKTYRQLQRKISRRDIRVFRLS